MMPQGKGVVAIEAQSLCKKIKKRIFKITGEFLLMLPFFIGCFSRLTNSFSIIGRKKSSIFVCGVRFNLVKPTHSLEKSA